MNLNFWTEIESLKTWQILKGLRLKEHFPMLSRSYQDLKSYDLVYVLVNSRGKPLKMKYHDNDTSSLCIFTSEDLLKRISKSYSFEDIQSSQYEDSASRPKTKLIMLGELISSLRKEKTMSTIKINPVKLKDPNGQEMAYLLSEEVLFAPLFDKFTKKLLMTDPCEARALLAIPSEDQSRLGMELVFYMITNNNLSEDKEERESELKAKVEELNFIMPRVPVKRGAGSFFVTLLNLENEFEESAFIRDSQMFDDYCDPVFVTSGLKLMSGRLEEIEYNGSKIDTIFAPMIEWQNKKREVSRSL